MLIILGFNQFCGAKLVIIFEICKSWIDIYFKKNNQQKVYILRIYSICDVLCKKAQVSYGYPMGMVWVSYDMITMWIGFRLGIRSKGLGVRS